MKNKDLLEKYKQLTPEQLEMEATVYVGDEVGVGFDFPIKDLTVGTADNGEIIPLIKLEYFSEKK